MTAKRTYSGVLSSDNTFLTETGEKRKSNIVDKAVPLTMRAEVSQKVKEAYRNAKMSKGVFGLNGEDETQDSNANNSAYVDTTNSDTSGNSGTKTTNNSKMVLLAIVLGIGAGVGLIMSKKNKNKRKK